MRNLVGVMTFLVALCLPLPSFALNTWGTDMSDLWGTPNESGWGLYIDHQQEVLFLTIFVYGTDNRARWYVASGMTSQGGANQFTFTGPLYETSGPYFGGAFNPAGVGIRQVGTAIASMQVETGSLTYTVDGVGVTKSIQRITFRGNNLSGSYLGGAVSDVSGCTSGNGHDETTAIFDVTHSGSAVSIAASITNGPICTYSGTYTQVGRMGVLPGSLSCTNGTRANFRAFEIEASYQGFFARYTVDYGGGCNEVGRLGGLKR